MRPLTKPIHGGNYVVIERRSSVSTQLPRGTSDTQKYLREMLTARLHTSTTRQRKGTSPK